IAKIEVPVVDEFVAVNDARRIPVNGARRSLKLDPGPQEFGEAGIVDLHLFGGALDDEPLVLHVGDHLLSIGALQRIQAPLQRDAGKYERTTGAGVDREHGMPLAEVVVLYQKGTIAPGPLDVNAVGRVDLALKEKPPGRNDNGVAACGLVDGSLD